MNPYLLFLKVWLVPFVALESLKLGAILLSKSSNKSTKPDQGSQVEAKIGPRKYSPEVPKNRDALPDERDMQMAPKGEPTSESLAYL